MDQLEKAIRGHLESYLADTTSLDELKDWLIGASRNIEETGSPEAIQLSYAVELALAEASSGYLTVDELQADLRKLTEQIPIAS